MRSLAEIPIILSADYSTLLICLFLGSLTLGIVVPPIYFYKRQRKLLDQLKKKYRLENPPKEPLEILAPLAIAGNYRNRELKFSCHGYRFVYYTLELKHSAKLEKPLVSIYMKGMFLSGPVQTGGRKILFGEPSLDGIFILHNLSNVPEDMISNVFDDQTRASLKALIGQGRKIAQYVSVVIDREHIQVAREITGNNEQQFQTMLAAAERIACSLERVSGQSL